MHTSKPTFLRTPRLLCACAPAMALALVFGAFALPASAQNKFENKDTAQDRHDSTWGTRQQGDGGGYFGTGEHGESAWGYQAPEPEPERDWYDEVIITVDPDVGYGTKTTTRESFDAAGESTGSTRTTISND
jgi:hypothetical protein